LVRFCPDSADTGLRLFFNALQIGPGDQLRIFDGPDTTSPVLIALQNIELDSFQVQASVQNASGCLVFLFVSDATGEGEGWDANLSCGTLCQRIAMEVQGIEAERDTNDPFLIPLCRGEGISARVALAFPDNRARYEQALSSTSVSWLLNGKNERNGLTYSKMFDTPGSGSLWVRARDAAGCMVLQPVAEILVAPSPVFEPSAPGLTPVVCAGDTLRLNAAIGIAQGQKLLNVFPGWVRRASGDTLRPVVQSLRWRYQAEMIYQLRDSAAALADMAGLRSYILQASDALGCVSEYRLSLEVLPQSSPDCPNCLPDIPALPDTAICEGDSLSLRIDIPSQSDSLFAYKSNPQYPIGYANHPPAAPYTALLPVKSLPFQALDNPVAQIERVCVTLRTDWAEDITLALRAPSGEQLELSSGNGGGLDDYAHTCFSPGASLPVSRADAPFNGIFAPEGDWNELQGARAAGEWALLVSDAFDSLQYGYLEEWSIVFKGQNERSFRWSPSEGISCVSCNDIVIKPLQSTSYVLEYFDTKGCSKTDTLRVEVREALPAPEPECSFSRTGQAVFSWTAVPDAVAYKLFFQINGKDTALTLPALDTFSYPPIFTLPGMPCVWQWKRCPTAALYGVECAQGSLGVSMSPAPLLRW
jgi:subtilisin-like proprotein convertase family protein